MKSFKVFTILAIFSILFCNTILAQKRVSNKPRVIVTADPELDDNNSLIRFLMYSADLQVEGLVYASSQFHWKGDGKGTKFMVPGREYTKFGLNLCPCTSYRWKENERFIHEAVEAYEKVYQNLKVHNANYPSPAYLKSITKYGNIEFEGDYSKDTEGSDLIKAAILDNKPGPLFLTAWGGQSTIARALKSIEDQLKGAKNWEQIKKKVSQKVVILPTGDQDGTYASYIQPNWPNIDYRQYRNGPNYGYGAQLSASKENAPYLTSSWMSANMTSKGPLGAIYRVWGDGKQMVNGDIFDYFGFDGYTNEQLKKMGYIVWMPVQEKNSWLGEGDTGSFMNLLPNGLEAWNNDIPGGWAGKPFYQDANYIDPFSNDTTKKKKDLVISESTYSDMNGKDNAIAFPNFFPAAQNDFAARMAWSVTKDFKSVNHQPKITLNIPSTITLKAGEKIHMKATLADPDKNQMDIQWAQFRKNEKDVILSISETNSTSTSVKIPNDAKSNQVAYLLVTVKDNGQIPLTTYKVVTINLE
jgi:hypothetical protein